MTTVEVRTRVIPGVVDSDASMPAVRVELKREEITVGELIERTVEEQVSELIATRKMEIQATERMLRRYYLSEEDVREQARLGAIKMPAKAEQGEQINVEAAIQAAKAAFKKRAYMLIVDGRRMNDLDERLVFQIGSKITFLRLVPLVGG